ncbi:Transcription factor bHLH96 [Heracleum sosnowskyi]|uniref:Transcription factor bHLH96 n=1 Tax=Heracleum sosnowskyi TaxID=360622 RepID=A0AAD8H3G7_9APIA|nr:Transcription factor bHLH96 [Heracleum sosnowskyi]
MALEEAIALQDLFSYRSSIDIYDIFGGGYNWGSNCDLVQTEEKLGSLNILESGAENFVNNNSQLSHLLESHVEQRGCNSSLELETTEAKSTQEFPHSETSTTIPCRPKRRRTRNKRNLEDIENQRMTHIAVERNRRKQMNEYLSLLRSLMPESYVQRVDQASIVGGAINYVKELEQQLQFLSVQNHKSQNFEAKSSSSPFSEFFAFPQYSTSSSDKDKSIMTDDDPWAKVKHFSSAMADIEVAMVENHANMKIRSKSRPRQLVKLVHELQILRLTLLHLSVTSLDQIVLYSLSVKVEDDCKLNSGEEVATAVNQILAKIQMEGGCFSPNFLQ